MADDLPVLTRRLQYTAIAADVSVGGAVFFAFATYLLGLPAAPVFVIALLSVFAGIALLAPRIHRNNFRPVRGGSLLHAPAALSYWLAAAAALLSLFALTRSDLYGLALSFAATLFCAVHGKALARTPSSGSSSRSAA